MVNNNGWCYDANLLPFQEKPSEMELLDYLLEADIRDYGTPVLQDVCSSFRSLPKDIVLQVKKAKNVSVPETSLKSQIFDTPSKGIIRYFLTDGHSIISAVSLDGRLKVNKGMKILFKQACPMESGFIVMDLKYINILGGGNALTKEHDELANKNKNKVITTERPPRFVDMMKPISLSHGENLLNICKTIGSDANNLEDTCKQREIAENKPKQQKTNPQRENLKRTNNPKRCNAQESWKNMNSKYEKDFSSGLTFTRSGPSNSQSRNRDGSSIRGNSYDSNRNTSSQQFRGNNRKYGTSQGNSNNRGNNRRNGATLMQASSSRYQPAQQFNAMSEFDFPTLEDSVNKISLR